MDIEITIKNYRCFADTSPVSFTAGKGFTALVGPNNSGKSSLLKMFYELRSLWGVLHSPTDLLPLFHGNRRQVGTLGVYDPREIFSDSNKRNIGLQFDLPPGQSGTTQPAVLHRIQIYCDRETLHWYGDFATTPPLGIQRSDLRLGEKGLLIDGSGQIRVNYVDMAKHFGKLANGIYIGPFRNALNQGASSYFDISIGSEFIATWNQWKTGQNKDQNLTIEQVTEDIRKVFAFKKLEIAAAQDLKTFQVNIDGKPYKLGELGAGLSQFIVVFGSVAIKKPAYIFIDEPEMSLHPSLQIYFITSLASYATEGVLFATHSIGLARAIGDGVYSLQRHEEGVVCRLFEQTPNYAEFAGEMSFSSYKELGFEKILLVEGVTDVKTVQQFLRKFDKDHKVVVLPLGGDSLVKGKVELELGELTRITVPQNIAALVDSECSSAGAAPLPARSLFQASCKNLGINAHLTKLRAIENYFSDRSIKEEMGSSFAALGPYERLKDSRNVWDKRESWRIARRMTQQELEATDIGEFLKSL